MKMGGVASVDQEMIRGRGIIRCIVCNPVITHAYSNHFAPRRSFSLKGR